MRKRYKKREKIDTIVTVSLTVTLSASLTAPLDTRSLVRESDLISGARKRERASQSGRMREIDREATIGRGLPRGPEDSMLTRDEPVPERHAISLARGSVYFKENRSSFPFCLRLSVLARESPDSRFHVFS